jgi:signal transduction histidine kinase
VKRPTIRGWAWIIASLAFASLSALAVVSVIALAPHAQLVRQATAPILPLYSAATTQERDLRDALAAAYRWVGSGNPAALAELQAIRSRLATERDPRLVAEVPVRFGQRLDRADSLVSAADAAIAQALVEQAAGRGERALVLLAAASADRKRVASLMSELVAASVEEAQASQQRAVAAADRARVVIAASVVLALALLVASVVLMRERVVRPMARLHDDVRSIAGGDLAHRAAVTSDDEIGELARDVNQMTSALEARLRQHDRLRAVGELAAGMAHELNNPLQVVLARSSQALQASSPEETRESMRLIQEHARRAGRVVAGLLSFVRARPAERRLSDLNAIVTDTVALLGDEFRSERVALETRLAPRLPGARVDPGQIGQVLVNLLANALRAAGATSRRTVVVETRAETDTVLVAVEDSGPGIPTEVRPRIFDPFFVGEGADGGVGLGLSVAAQIAIAHSGTLSLAEGRQGGARFELRLPAAPAAPPVDGKEAPAAVATPTAPPARTPAGGDGGATGLRLLVADDEDAVRNAWERYFTRLGARVTTARDGGEALDLIRRQDWDAILLDLKMPVVNGWEVVQAARQERPELASRIVVVSGDITALLELQTAEHLEPWRMLEKPTDLETVREAVLRAATYSRS